jgi:TolA-binding protein
VKECRGEILAKVRRGLASDQDRLALELHLGSCESCRMTQQVMGDFDAIGKAQPGDWDRVSRMATRAVAVNATRSRGPLRIARRTWPLAVAALVLTGVAIAGGAFQLTPWTNETDVPPAEGARSGPSPVVTPSVPERTETPTDAPAEAESPNTTPPDVLPAAQASRTSAADLYRAANDARRAGRTGQAIRDYQRLQRHFPGSSETHASRVSLGGLLLRTGSSGAALAQFDAYLVSGGGRLGAEALFGRAQALRALGRSAEEAQNLQRLIEQYPNSAYATHAQRRLHQLR